MNFRIFLNNYFPSTIRLVLIRALLFVVVYKFIFIIKPNIIHYPITTQVATYSTKLLNTVTGSSDFSITREYINSKDPSISSQVYYNGKKVVYVADECNGLLAMMRYLGLIFCFPSRFWRKASYIIFGILIIHILNILRCAGLIYINLFHQEYFDVTHLYLFKWTIYTVILLMWISYLQKISFQFNFPNKKASMV